MGGRGVVSTFVFCMLGACGGSPSPSAPLSASSSPSSSESPASPAATSARQPSVTAQNVRVTWLGHAAFEIVSSGGTRLLIDPWVKDNPKTPAAWKEMGRYGQNKPVAILVTHAHGDHAQDVPALAAASGALVVGTGEHLRAMKIPEPQQHTMNVGGSTRIGDVQVNAVPAMHSAEPGGRPLGYVLTFADGRTLYHTGDTWIFNDMALIEELYHPDILLIEAGGDRWGLDAKTAQLAVKKYFRPRVIVPMHFGTYPDQVSADADVRAAFAGDPRVKILTPGEPVLL